MTSQVFNIDCMEGMKQCQNKYFDLAVVDPPYGIDILNMANMPKKFRFKNWERKNWDKQRPEKEYFIELFRISKNQIIWGGNYFIDFLYPTQGWIFWFKQKGMTFADGELAWTSFNKAIRQYDHSGMGGIGKIHPTQKPIKLYDWIYSKYLPEGGKVIDTHLGSGSNRIAADKAGNIEFVGYELDKDYFEAQEKRWREYKMQQKLF